MNTKCSNKEYTHFYVNGTIGALCEAPIDSKNGIIQCHGVIILTKGQQFRNKFGFTPSFKRNMQRRALDPFKSESLTAYREMRKPLRIQMAIINKKKKDTLIAGKKTKVSINKSSKS